MKKDFEFKSEEIRKEFEKLSSDELRSMTLGFLNDYGLHKTALGKRVDLNPRTIIQWLDGTEPLGERSLKRIFAFLWDYYPHWRDFINEGE